MINILNGGIHADNSLEVQEFLIRPHAAKTFAEAVRWGSEIFHTLKEQLKTAGYVTSVGDEGGFAPNLPSTESAIETIIQAIEKAGYIPGKQVSLALDFTASWLFDETTKKYIEKKKKISGKQHAERTIDKQVNYLVSLCSQYPLDSIEDPLSENDWEGWGKFTKRLGKNIQIIGDDIFVTNPKILK